MSQMNVQNILRLGQGSIEIPQVGAEPIQQGNTFSGGAVQLGAPARSTGPSAEEAMFGALRDIAGGVKTSIDVFGSIRSQNEKTEIDKAKVKFKEIFSGDYTESKTETGEVVRSYGNPAEKMEAWNTYIRDIWTPLLGDTWVKDLNIDAYSAFGNREAQNKFEEDRWGREYTKWRTKNNKIGNTESEQALVDFNEFYVETFPTADSNQWFKYKQAQSNSALADKYNRLAIQNLNISIANVLPIPDESEIQTVLNGGSEKNQILGNYTAFFDRVGTYKTMTLPEIRTNVYEFLYDQIIVKNPEKYQEYTLRELEPVLKVEAAKYADSVRKATGAFRRAETIQQANTNVANATFLFQGSKNPISDTQMYFQALVDNVPDMDITPDKQIEVFMGSIGTTLNNWDQAVAAGNGLEITEQHPNWSLLSPFEKIQIVREHIRNLGRNLDIARIAGVPKDQLNDYLESASRAIASNDPTFQKAVEEWNSRNKIQTNLNIQSIGLMGTEQAVDSFTNSSLGSISISKYGVPVEEWRKLYTEVDSKGITQFRTEKDFATWYKSLSEESRKNLALRGINLGNVKQMLETDANLAQQIEQAALEHKSKLTSGSGPLTEEQQNAYIRSAQEFAPNNTPNITQSQGSLVSGLITGRFAQSNENRKYLDLVRQAYHAQKTLLTLPQSAYNQDGSLNLTKLTPQQQAAHAFVMSSGDIHSIFKYMKSDGSPGNYLDDHVSALFVLDLQVQALQPRLLEALPGFNGLTGEEAETYANNLAVELERMSMEFVTGGAEPYDGRVPNNAWNGKDFTYEGKRFLVQSILIGSTLGTSSNWSERDRFGDAFKKITEGLGNVRDINELIQNPQKALQATALMALGLEYKKNYDRGLVVNVGNASYVETRLFLMGAAAEDYSLGNVADFFTNPEFRAKADLAVAMPLVVASMQVPDTNVEMTFEMGGGNAGRVGMVYTLEDKSVAIAMSALGVQLDPQIGEQLNQQQEAGKTIVLRGNEGLSPSDPNWSVDTFVSNMQSSGFFGPGETIQGIAISMRDSILSGSIDPTLPPLSDEETIRKGATLLWETTSNNRRLLSGAMRGFMGPVGKHPLFAPGEGERRAETQSRNFFNFLGTALDIDLIVRNPLFVTGAYTTQDTPFNKQQVEISPGVFGSFYAVYNQNPSRSSNNFNLTATLNEFVGNKDLGMSLLEDVTGKYNPKKNGAISANGMLFKVGSTILEHVPDDATFLAAITPWLEAEGLVTPGYQTMPDLLLSDEQEVPINSKPAKLALMAVLSEGNQDLTFKEKIEMLNEVYIAGGGTRRLINSKYNSELPGFSTITQEFNTGNVSSFLPSYDWINRDFNGPLLSLNNAFFTSFLDNTKKFQKRLQTLSVLNNEKQKEEERLSEMEKSEERLNFMSGTRGIP